MSVLTYHEINNEEKNLFDRLVQEGIIHSGEIYSPKSHELKRFANVFDYTKCNDMALERLEERQVERDKAFEESIQLFYGYIPDEEDRMIKENKKCDFRLMPVVKSPNGGVSWVLNYASDDMPAIAIEYRFPEEVFEYYQETEGETDCHLKTKNGEVVKNLFDVNQKECPF